MDPGAGLGRVAAGAPQLPSSPGQECFPGRVPRAPRCRSNPTHPTGMARAALASLLPEVTYFTCRARTGWDQAARCGRRQPVGSARGDRRLRPLGEGRIPAVVSHGRAATMALLLRFVLLCGVAGESGGRFCPSGPPRLASPRALAARGHPGTMRRGGGGDLGALRPAVAVRAELRRGGSAAPDARAA